jgi:hypothetical protein
MGSRGRPKALQDEEDGDTDEHNAPPETLAQFLRDIHQESTESIAEADSSADPNTLPSLGWLKEHFKTKSATIRYLVIDRGFPVNRVAKHLGLKYQHVRNVSTQKLKRGPNEDFHLSEGQAVKAFQTEPIED